MRGSPSFYDSIIVPSRVVFLMWLIFFVQVKFHIDLRAYGLFPRTAHGLIGILTMPLLHGNVFHIVSNTIPILVLGAMLYFFYPRMANRIFYQCFFFTNVLVWIFARSANHIGASGLLYGLAAFLVLLGLFRRDFKSVLISGAVFIIYGSIFLNLIPSNSWVSWESHLMGVVVGATNAYLLRRAA